MILINNNWEIVEDMDDVIRFVSENISQEFADKVSVIYKLANVELQERIHSLETELTDMKNGEYTYV